MSYDLWSTPGMQGQGEFVRLTLEAAEIDYTDCARERGMEALHADLAGRTGRRPFAPPYLVYDKLVIAPVANILTFLGERHDLAPSGIADRLWLSQMHLTTADIVAEVCAVHHPRDPGLPYDVYKPEAVRAAARFRQDRLPRYLAHFEDAAGCNAGEWLIDHRWSPADCSLFQLVEGLRHMFPRRMATLEPSLPRLLRIHEMVAELPGVRAYLRSDRRVPFDDRGVFRHDPELDAA